MKLLDLGGFFYFTTMDNLETTEVIGSQSPAADAGVSSPAADAPVGGVENAPVSTDGAPAAIVEEGKAGLPDLPETDDDLTGQEQNPHVQALLNLRGQLRTLRTEHTPLKQQITSWQPFIERYEKPENLQTAFETGRGLFSETGQLDPQTQLPIRSAVPNLLKLGQQSESDFLLLADNMMNGVTYDGKPVIMRGLEKIGLNPDHIEQYQQWEREGFSPQNTTAYSEAETDALNSIPDKFKPAFDKAPQEVQRDWLNMPENLRNYHLEREQRDFDAQQAQQRGAQEAQAKFNQEIQSNSWNERLESFGMSYGQLMKDLEPWQPTGNTAIDGLYRHSIGQLLTNVFDPQMNSDPALPFSVIPILQQIAPDVDVKTLAAQADEWDKQRDLAVRYEAFNNREQGRYQQEATQARNEANRTLRNLNARMGQLAKGVVKYLTGDADDAKAAEAAAAQNGGRPRVTGVPNGHQPPPQGGYNTDWRKSFHG